MPRSVIVDGVEMKECSKCKELKPITNFYRNLRNLDGHHSQCKVCNKKNRTPESTIISTTEILEALGYDTDPNNPISVHKQFLIKHNLK